ncbi:MAG: SDR family oxidoreductase [Spirochaetia bacterium]
MEAPVLVVGATGYLGRKVVSALVARGKTVRALVRDGTDPGTLRSQGVEIVPGNMLDPSSLDRALEGARALVTTAIGYSARKPGDTLASVDDQGNRNLIDAAHRAKLGRFVFTSILTCDLAREVPHFWQKKLIEDYLVESGVPFVSLRPGAFLNAQWWAKDLKKGRLSAIGSATRGWTYIHPDDVARCLALAVDESRALGRRIDLGADRPVSATEIAALCSKILGRRIRPRVMPAGIMFGVMGLFNPRMRDFASMLRYFLKGTYIADTSAQAELFGPVPSIEDSLRRALKDAGLP